MLYLVATPIGNLEDITARAVAILKSCDYILCEDTRHSRILLTRYDILTPLKSFHKFNETAREDSTIEDLKSGKNVAVISDAGTPGISDPGAQLVQKCVEADIPVTTAPGPCAAVAALVCSGFDTTQFQFCGFLPRKESELKHALQGILAYSGTTICYEAPHRLLDVLSTLQTVAPERMLCVAREITKKFEHFHRGTAEQLLQIWKDNPPKGEIVLLIAAGTSRAHEEWSAMTPQEHVAWMEKTYHISKQEAIKAVATLRGVPKKEIYRAVHIEG